MIIKNDGIRKAAVLVAALDRRAADLVLDQMEPEQAGRVRQAVLELGPIDAEEQRRVVDEFFRVGPKGSAKPSPAAELAGRLGQNLRAGSDRFAGEEGFRSGLPGGGPFGFLHEAEGAKLAAILASERSQTIALVLSHLPHDQAGSVLVRFSPNMQADIIRRLIDLEETEPEVLQEVEEALRSRLSEHIQMQRRRVAGMSAIAGILDASEKHVGMQILDNLSLHDRQLAEKLSPGRLEFDDLTRLDDASLSAVFKAADPNVTMLALVGAPPELIDRILAKLPESEVTIIRHHLDHLGPTRLSDVEEARRQIAELTRRLAIERRVVLPGNVPRHAPPARFARQA